ncbi:MAG TPA: hypothetical protein DEP51_04820 [Clostridiales bacterium]|nr:hypothetical protein [Clostridiales bacterium]
MLMEVKNQIKVMILSFKYAVMREMLNKVTFLSNIIFMILNNSFFIIQWVVLFSLRENVGGYTFNQVLMLWAIASGTFGFAHFFFKKAYSLSDTITNGKLDAYLVQPKNVLISCITSDVSPSALGDLIYGYIVIFLSGITISKFILYTFFVISGGIIMVDIAIILGSLSFYISKSDMIAETGNNFMIYFATYPDGIFKGIVKIILFTIIPIGITTYIPVWVLTKFNLFYLLGVITFTICVTIFTFVIFYKGLKRYSSSNLMVAKI